tara:strand:+ start:1373 stop:1564 length:192 start_codon:yes stop_codon:yes gene_type:complete
MSFTLCIRTLCSFTEDTESNHRDLQVVEEEPPKPLSMKGTFKDKNVENPMDNNQVDNPLEGTQ